MDTNANQARRLCGRAACALAHAGGGGTPLAAPLRPGQPYPTEPVFDVEREVKAPVFLLNEEFPPTYFIIGHESSLLRGQTKFRLDGREQ